MAKVLSRPKSTARGQSSRPFTRAELERMYDAGILRPDEKIELIGGELVPKEIPMKSAHATAIRLCVRALQNAFPEEEATLWTRSCR